MEKAQRKFLVSVCAFGKKDEPQQEAVAGRGGGEVNSLSILYEVVCDCLLL